MEQDRIQRIASRLCTAKFRLNYDHITMDEQGLFVELDGNLDYKSIGGSLLGEANNLKKLANEFSKTLLSQKNDVEQLRGVDVESIDVNQYRIVHDENKNRIWLFLPMDALKTTAKDERENAVSEDAKRRTLDMVGRIADALGKFVSGNECTYRRMRITDKADNGYTEVFNILTMPKQASDTLDGYEAECTIDRVVSKRSDAIESNVYLKVRYDGQIVYDKVVKNSFALNDYGIMMGIRQQYSLDIPVTGGEGNEREVKELVDAINKAEEMAVKAFRQDLTSDRIVADMLAQADAKLKENGEF